MFYLIVLLNYVFDYCNNLLSSSVDKVATGIYNFLSVIENTAFVGALIPATKGLTPGPDSLHALCYYTICRPC